MYFEIQKLPEVGKKEILVNFDTDSSIFASRSATTGKVAIIFARLDSDANTYES
jgi:hypothetical protein